MNSSKTWILWTPTVLLSCLSAFPCTPVHAMQKKTKPAKRSPGVNWWIYFESRESTKGKTPQLLITTRKGKNLRVKASADATLIQYLGKRSFGSMKMLAVGTMDKNRSASCAGQATRGT